MLSPKLLEVLRAWWPVHKPKQWLFPGDRVDSCISSDAVEIACQKAHQRCGIAKPVTPHSLRHYLPFRTMSSIRAPALFFWQMREVAPDIVLTPSISPIGRQRSPPRSVLSRAGYFRSERRGALSPSQIAPFSRSRASRELPWTRFSERPLTSGRVCSIHKTMSRDKLGLCTRRSGISGLNPQKPSITRHNPEG